MSGPSEKTKRPISRRGTEGTQRIPADQSEYSLRTGAETKTLFRLLLIMLILLISLAAIVLNLSTGGIALSSWTRPLSRPSCHAHCEGKAELLDKSFLDHLERMRKKWEIAGMVVSVVASPKYTKGDWKQNIWGFGDADSHGKAVTPETMWGIASNSKLFVALSIGLLVDRKASIPGVADAVLGYDTKVKAVLPWWGVMDAYAEEHLTVLDMLGMRSGLPSHDFYHELNTHPRDGLPALKHLRPSAEIRDTWQYNNQHYFTLAEIVSTLSGMPFTDFVQEEIFNPLNMTTTTYNSTVAKESGHRAEAILHHGMNWKACKAYKAGDTRVPEGCLGKKAGFGWWTEGSGMDEAGAGAMVISGNDMAKWIRELLDPQHLPAHLVTRCAEPISVMPLAFGPIDSVWTYGMAQMRTTYRGQTIIMHTGGLPGSLSILVRLPDLGVGLMVATNDDFAGALFFRATAMSIVDDLIGPIAEVEVEWDEAVMPALWSEGSLTAPPAHPYPPTPSKLGRYYNAAYGYLNFTRADPHDAGDDSTLAALRSVHRPLRVDERTHIAHLSKAFVNTLAFTHFDGQLWNWTTLTMFDTPDGRLTSQTQTSGSAIVTEEGIGMFGNYWVAGPGVEVMHAHEGSKKDDAEVWYGRIEYD